MSENKVRVSAIITDQNITVNYNGETHIVSRKGDLKSVALADALIQALKQRAYDKVPNLVSAAKRVENYGKGDFKVEGGTVLVRGRAIPSRLAKKILDFQEQGLPHEPLVKFAENLMNNPSYRAVNALFDFLEVNNQPITDTGCFIAYKKVKEDFKDCHTGTFDNSVGAVVSMPRNEVNEDPNQTCSSGLHVANWDYAHNFYPGGVMLEVEVNPADVVAVPVDYNQAKMRTCKYTVMGVVIQPHADGTQLRTTVTPATSTGGYESCGACGSTEETCSCEEDECQQCWCTPCECDEEEDDDPRDACEDE